ncbi:MAG: tartrate dehydrogenase [candidate division NC10 bacterium]|nr:tartrate dehydrogenase [candidate division NC10 bacterium]
MIVYKLAVVPGDGIGGEVVAEGVKVLEAISSFQGGFTFHFTSFEWGTDYYFKHGRMMPEDALETLKAFDAISLGAVGDPRLPDHVTLHGLLLPIRRAFDQYINLRPAYLFPGVESPLRDKKPGEIDMMVVRENTEGEYADVGGRVYQGFPSEVAVQAAVYTRQGVERVVRYAFQLARRRKRKLCSITKSNAQRFGPVLWDQVVKEVAKEYPEVEVTSLLIDAACMKFVLQPEAFDVVVASNLFGDILTDLSAAVVGGLGLAPAANLNPTRAFPSMFEPVHGSAPDIAGKGIANPLAAILTAGMMLEFLGEPAAAQRVHRAVERTLAEGKVRTPDMGGRSVTAEVGDEVVRDLTL